MIRYKYFLTGDKTAFDFTNYLRDCLTDLGFNEITILQSDEQSFLLEGMRTSTADKKLSVLIHVDSDVKEQKVFLKIRVGKWAKTLLDLATAALFFTMGGWIFSILGGACVLETASDVYEKNLFLSEINKKIKVWLQL